jgi:hypothetical protein
MNRKNDMTDIVERLKSWDRCYPGNINIEEAVDEVIDEIILLREEIAKLQKETVKQRFALIDIQWKAQDILRPIPFQDEDDV